MLVAHEQNLAEALDVNLGTEGEAAIFRPRDDGGSGLVTLESCRRNGRS